MDKILTLIIPTYNMEKYLDICLTSLVISDSELMKQLEVLIVIDGATDSSSEIAHRYEVQYPGTFRVIDKENGNYGSCINRGLKEATGKYIKVLDADDWFDTDAFENYLTRLKTVNADLVLTDYVRIETETGNKTIEKYQPINSIESIDENYPYIQMHAVTYLTSMLRQMNYVQTEGISYTDMEWTFLPMAVVNSIAYFELALYQYRLGRNGQTVDPSVYEKNFWQDIKVTETIVYQYKSIINNINPPNQRYLRNRMVSRINNIYHSYFKIFDSDYNHSNMVNFDKFILNHLPDIYKEFESNTWGYGVLKNYRYIKNWRKCYFYKPPLLWTISSLSRFRKKIMQK